MCTSCGSKSMSLQGLKGDGVARVIQRPSRSNVFTFKPSAGSTLISTAVAQHGVPRPPSKKLSGEWRFCRLRGKLSKKSS